MKYIDTEKFSEFLRRKSILETEQKVLIARIYGSEQEKDMTTPVNCKGYGRIRHFRLQQFPDWSSNPLPILPAAKALGYSPDQTLRAQVFQNAACNWRCWYCFVDYDRLSADTNVSDYFTSDELIQMYLNEVYRPDVIDISGGQPDLAPEWILWIMESLKKRGLEGKIYLWSDDNLSNKYFFTYLTRQQRQFIAKFRNYSRVACFKGYDENSFSFNTLASPELFNQQFEIYKGLLNEGLDMYAYVTFTVPPQAGLAHKMEQFVDKLQAIHPNLPLRTVPLKITTFSPARHRIKHEQSLALNYQYEVHAKWIEQISNRFSESEINIPICDIPMAL